MDELDSMVQENGWDAGFVAGSQVVVARMGPYRDIFQRPQHYRRRFFHRVYELAIEDWQIAPLMRQLGGVCQIQVSLDVRFQPSLAYVRAHPDCLPDAGRHVRAKFQPLILDQAEQVLRELEDGDWLVDGSAAMERRLEDAVQVALAVQHVRCRCLCRIQADFGGGATLDQATPAGLRLRENYLALRRRQEQDEAQRLRDRLAEEEELQRLQLEHQSRLLDLAQATREVQRQAQQHATAELQEKLSAEEARLRESMESEARRHQEQLRHEQETQKLKLAGEMADLQQRMRTLADKDDVVKRELELLYLEKQRLILQEEIRGLQKSGAERSH